jgi:hypothetical protein
MVVLGVVPREPASEPDWAICERGVCESKNPATAASPNPISMLIGWDEFVDRAWMIWLQTRSH